MMLIQKEHENIGWNVQWAIPAAADELPHHLRDWISVSGGKSFIFNTRFYKKRKKKKDKVDHSHTF